MSTLAAIEAQTKSFAEVRRDLSAEIAALEAEIAELKRRRLPAIRILVGQARAAEADLRSTIEQGRDLFQRPKTIVMHGIKVGLGKGRGRLEYADAAHVVKLIRKHFPDKIDELVKVEESPVKGALNQMSAAELRKIGVTVVEAGEEVVVKATDGDVEKIVDALLKDAATETDNG
ncbi:MAG: hypothetical protein LDL44_03195 [Caenispirillum sp.]|nr:hypothetical protein [Caenispirillum sp.]